MKRMMHQSVKHCLISLGLLAQIVPLRTFGDEFSCQYILSRHFSSIERTGAEGIEVTLMDIDFPWTVVDCVNRGREWEADPGEKVRLRFGDSFDFFVLSFPAGMKVSVTNGAYRSPFAAVPERFADSRQLVVFDGRGYACPKKKEGKTVRPHRVFIYDVAGEDLFDVESNAFRRLSLPFRSLWKDWDDYLENFSGLPKVNFVESSHSYAKYLRERAERSLTLRDFCQSLTNDVPCVVRYWAENDTTNFALVRKRGPAFEVLGLAEIGFGGESRTHMLDEGGRLRWKSEWPRTGSSRGESHYEFGDDGAVQRFVELDGKGREVRRRRRRLKDGTMLAPEGRAAFRAEAEAAASPLIEAWANRRFAVVPNVLPPPPEEARRIAEENAKREREKREREEKYARINKERQAAGLPPLTRLDRSRIRQDETNELVRQRLEKLRQEATGRFETTELDAATDRERARLKHLATVLDLNHERLFENAVSGSWPKTLRDLIGLMRYPKINVPLLLNGEKDIRDQWGREYRYHHGDVRKTPFGKNRPLITSAGPDGVFDTADDITSLDEFKLLKQKEEREHAGDRRAVDL